MKPYIESEVFDKTKRKGALAEEAARVASGMSRTLASAMAQKGPAPPKQGKADAKTKVFESVLESRISQVISCYDFSENDPFIDFSYRHC